MVFSLQTYGKLCASNIGDEEKTIINDGDENIYYDDIIHHNGQLYVVDMKWRQFIGSIVCP